MKATLKELTRKQLENFLLDVTFTDDLDVANAMMNPRNRYTILSKMQKYNNVKL